MFAKAKIKKVGLSIRVWRAKEKKWEEVGIIPKIKVAIKNLFVKKK